MQKLPDDAAPGEWWPIPRRRKAATSTALKLSGELVTRAQQTGARIRFIEDPGAAGRYRRRWRVAAVPYLRRSMSRENKVNPGTYTQARPSDAG